MKGYCLGFAFTDHENFVILIRKNKPEWQRGLFNGVGGLIEPGECSNVAMAREFQEETGIETFCTDWTPVTQMDFPDDTTVFCYATRLPRHKETFTQMTEELVGLHSLTELDHPKLIPNLRWLIPMALEVLNNPKHFVPQVLKHFKSE